MKPRGLRAHANVYPLADIAEERRLREQQREGELIDDMGFRVMFVGFRTHVPENAPPAAPEGRWRPKWFRAMFGLGKRSRAS